MASLILQLPVCHGKERISHLLDRVELVSVHTSSKTQTIHACERMKHLMHMRIAAEASYKCI